MEHLFGHASRCERSCIIYFQEVIVAKGEGAMRKCVFGVILIGSGVEQMLRGEGGQSKSALS